MSPRTTPPPQLAAPIAPRRTWLIAATIAVLAPILLPCLVAVMPVIYFDVDPRSQAGRAAITSIGPAGAAWLHAASVLAAAFALTVTAAVGSRIRWVACGLVALGMGACAYHMAQGSFDDLLNGGGWIAAAALGLAAAHLAQHKTPRRWMAAALLAILLAIAVQAIWYVMVEHAATVRMFQSHKAQAMQSQGITAGSPQAELYIRRLTDSSAIGAFGLSNVLGSIAAALTVLGAAVTWGFMRNRTQARFIGPVIAAGGLTVLGAVTVVLTQSKGALAAGLAGIGLLMIIAVVTWWVDKRGQDSHRDWGGMLGRLLPPAALGLILLAVLAVLARGWAGPPSRDVGVNGERSLLFRYYYWEAASRILAHDSASQVVAGVGSTGFAREYLRYKNPFDPEEVTSTHNVVLDFVTMLGVGGAAWAVLLLLWLWQGAAATGMIAAGRTVDSDAADSLPLHAQAVAKGTGGQVAGGPRFEMVSKRGGLIRQEHVLGAGALGVVIFGTQYAFHIERMWLATALLWVVSLVGFVMLTAVLAAAFEAADADRDSDPGGDVSRRIQPGVIVGLFLAGLVIMLHNQIEMTFFHLSSLPLAWGLVGLAAGAAGSLPVRAQAAAKATGGQTARGTHGGLPAGDPHHFAMVSKPGMRRWIRFLPAAALAVGAIALAVGYAGPINAQQSHVALAANLLQHRQPLRAMEELDRAAAIIPIDERTLRWRVSLRLAWASQLAQRMHQPQQAAKVLAETLAILDQARAAGMIGPAVDRFRSQTQRTAAQLLHEPQRLADAAQALRRAVALSPYNLRDQVQLADLERQLGHQAAADKHYRRALKISDLNYLDPARQLTPEQVASIKAKIGE